MNSKLNANLHQFVPRRMELHQIDTLPLPIVSSQNWRKTIGQGPLVLPIRFSNLRPQLSQIGKEVGGVLLTLCRQDRILFKGVEAYKV